MEIYFKIFDSQENRFLLDDNHNDAELLIGAANLNQFGGELEGLALILDGRLVVCDTCGNFGILPRGRFRITARIEINDSERNEE